MKLFDRSVDLAQFGEATPLYPICRAWMRNQPHNRNLGASSAVGDPRSHSPSPQHGCSGVDVSCSRFTPFVVSTRANCLCINVCKVFITLDDKVDLESRGLC